MPSLVVQLGTLDRAERRRQMRPSSVEKMTSGGAWAMRRLSNARKLKTLEWTVRVARTRRCGSALHSVRVTIVTEYRLR